MTKATHCRGVHISSIDISSTCAFIQRTQKPNGEIPWSEGGKTDLWDHIESAMGLTIGGAYSEARKAYAWAAGTQLSDGSWWSYYRNGRPVSNAYKDSNMSAYIAVGALHYYLSTGDLEFLHQIWPTILRAMDYVISMQGKEGGIFWAKRVDGSIDKRALLTGSSSIYKSLSSALCIGRILGEALPSWERAKQRLGRAIRTRPRAFDQSKSRYAMDWYYPVLSGAATGTIAYERLGTGWDTFIIPEWGARCVSDKPWVTLAETAELVIALAACGRTDTAEKVFSWIREKKYEDGAYWTGLTYPDQTIYTIEKTTWTAAAVLMANDVLYGFSPASRMFDHGFEDPEFFEQMLSPDAIHGPLIIVPN